MLLAKSKGVGSAIKNKFNESKRLDTLAASEMDKRYPAGWAQSSANMEEMRTIRRGLKK
jgi:hypothetical protein